MVPADCGYRPGATAPRVGRAGRPRTSGAVWCSGLRFPAAGTTTSSSFRRTRRRASRRVTVSTRPRLPAPVAQCASNTNTNGAWPGPYLAALDVHRAQVIGCCEAQTGITPFRRLVERVMTTAPYRQARRVFWIVDNGSSHRGARSIQLAKTWDPRLQLVHTPCHASWLNQIEIYGGRGAGQRDCPPSGPRNGPVVRAGGGLPARASPHAPPQPLLPIRPATDVTQLPPPWRSSRIATAPRLPLPWGAASSGLSVCRRVLPQSAAGGPSAR